MQIIISIRSTCEALSSLPLPPRSFALVLTHDLVGRSPLYSLAGATPPRPLTADSTLLLRRAPAPLAVTRRLPPAPMPLAASAALLVVAPPPSSFTRAAGCFRRVHTSDDGRQSSTPKPHHQPLKPLPVLTPALPTPGTDAPHARVDDDLTEEVEVEVSRSNFSTF